MLKYIFAAIFIALAWALVLVFHDVVPMWPAIVVTAVIVVGLVALRARSRCWRAKKAASAIERGPARSGLAPERGGMRPDLRGRDRGDGRPSSRRASRPSRRSKLGRSGRDALGVLPWYVMIGPPASGKTTAIRSSGLKIPAGKAARCAASAARATATGG